MADAGLSQEQLGAAAADSGIVQSYLQKDGEQAYPLGFGYLRGALATHHADFIYGHIAAVDEQQALADSLRRMPWDAHARILDLAARCSLCPVCQGHGSTDFGSVRQKPCGVCASDERLRGPLGFMPKETFLSDRTLRPHLAALVAAAENWGEVKDRLFGTFGEPQAPDPAARAPGCPCHAGLLDGWRDGVESALAPPRRELLLTLILFRRAYFSESIFKLRSIVNADEAALAPASFATTRDRFRAAVAQQQERLQALGPAYQGAGLIAQSVGSTDLTSDYDVSLSGVHDLACLAELNESFRAAWGKESGYVFDTNVYCRDYARLRDNIYPVGGTAKPDTCPQPTVDEVTSDLYALTKIRRYTSKIEWRALAAAIRREPGDSSAAPASFARIDTADSIYLNLYVQPLLSRVAAVQERFAQAAVAQFAADYQGKQASEEERRQLAHRTTKQTARTLERLFKYDSNSVLRACNLAFVELAAVARREDQRLRLAAAAQEELARSWGRLTAQSMLFATDAYYTQSACWDVVGSQTGSADYPLTVDHFLHCFNEQVGDALKELRQYQRMVDGDIEAAKHMPKAHSSDPSAAHLGFYRAAKYADRMLACMDNILGRLYGTRSLEYRQIRQRLSQRQLIRDAVPRDFAPEPALQRRREAFHAESPGQKCADDLDLERLTKELYLTAIFGKNIPELLLIRKARGAYGTMSLLEKKERAKELVRATVGSEEFRAAFTDPDRAAAEPRYGEAAGNPAARTKYDAAIDEDGQIDAGWGLRELTWFLLWHCAQVNKLVRRIRGRG